MKGLYKLDVSSRQNLVADKYSQIEDLKSIVENKMAFEVGDSLIENFIGYFSLPVGIVPDMPVGDKLIDVILAVEESSVVAALNKTSKIFRENGEISIEVKPRTITGQISYFKHDMQTDLTQKFPEILLALKDNFKSFFKREGQILSFEKQYTADFVIFSLTINPLEAMGANLVTSMGEFIGRFAQEQFGCPAPLMSILSNSSSQSHIVVTASLPMKESLGHRIEAGSKLAEQLPERASTHNKGIMNAIDPILIVTGNDWRANNAMIHSYAAQDGYAPIATWRYRDGILSGKLEVPMSIGIVGGATKVHPSAQAALKLMNIQSSADLASIAATAGLLQNFAALSALVGEGIISGHMGLHIDNIAHELAANADEREKLKIALKTILTETKKVSHSDGVAALKKIRL